MPRHARLLVPVLLLLVVSALAADVEYSTTGAMDAPATLGGDRDGWGTDFVARWTNTTGADVIVEELAWPCGGWWAQFWYVWITDALPPNPWTLEHYGTFVAASEDDTEWPPSVYTHIDVSGEGIVVPAGAGMIFGYGNPGMGGQIGFNGTETYSWLDDGWDMDGDFGRTAVLQFRGSFGATAAPPATHAAAGLEAHPNPFNPVTSVSFTLPRDGAVRLDVITLQGKPVRRLLEGFRSAGRHAATWDGTDPRGRALPSGVYLMILETPAGVESRKVVLAR